MTIHKDNKKIIFILRHKEIFYCRKLDHISQRIPMRLSAIQVNEKQVKPAIQRAGDNESEDESENYANLRMTGTI